MTGPACCIVYTTDQGYLFPTLVSAMQARRHAPRAAADVMIFAFGVAPQAAADFATICARETIRFMSVNSDLVEGAGAMMARLFLNRFVPPEYGHYLYIDGDTQITGPLDALLAADVPPGQFLAANDPMTFQLDERADQDSATARHMRALHLAPRQAARYFNSGVLRINRSGWDEIGQLAWKLCRESGHSFRFPDQDPLNMVAADRHIAMSLAWNFPIFLRNARVERDIEPVIYHYMASPKPWKGIFPPWHAQAFAPYDEAVQLHGALAPLHIPYGLRRRIRYHLQQRYKQATETFTWGFSGRRRHILRYEAQAWRAGALPAAVAVA